MTNIITEENSNKYPYSILSQIKLSKVTENKPISTFIIKTNKIRLQDTITRCSSRIYLPIELNLR